MISKIDVKNYEVRDDGIYYTEIETYQDNENDFIPVQTKLEKLIITSDALKEAYEKYIKEDERMNKTNELRRPGFRRKRKTNYRAWNNH